jgi:hypothetical protein
MSKRTLLNVTHFDIRQGLTEVEGELRATEVQLLVHITNFKVPVALRFLSSEALDQLTDTLREQRAFVFGRRWDEPPPELFEEQSSSNENC